MCASSATWPGTLRKATRKEQDAERTPVCGSEQRPVCQADAGCLGLPLVDDIGAAGGAVSAVPGSGAAVKLVGGTVPETGALLERASCMIMGVAEA